MRPGRRLAGVAVWQVVTVELVVAVVAVAVARRDWTAAPAAVMALTLVAAVAVRVGHRRPLTALAVRWRRRSRLRDRRRDHPVTDPTRLAPLLALHPALHITAIELRNDRELGVAFDGAGWAGVIAVHRDDDLTPHPHEGRWLPVGTLARVLTVDDIRLASLQVLVHVVPSPAPTLPPGSVTAVSYRQANPGGVPAHRQTLVTLRLDPATSREAIEARGGGTRGARRALKRSVSRAVELLDAAGVVSRPLSELGARAALGHVAGLPADATAAQHPPQEGRRHLQLAGVTSVTWWVSGWPETDAPMRVLTDVVATLPVRSAVVSLELHPGAEEQKVRIRALVRLSAGSPDAAEATGKLLLRAAHDAGFRLRRLDGEQALGFAATLPLGGRP